MDGVFKDYIIHIYLDLYLCKIVVQRPPKLLQLGSLKNGTQSANY